MLKYCLKTTYYRGKGPQRIRKLILLETTGTDTYTGGTGLIDGDDGGLAPGLVTINDFPAQPFGQIRGGPIVGRIRDCVLRTVEPRFHDGTDFAITGLVVGAFSFVNMRALTLNTMTGAKRVQIRIYHVPATGGFMESGNMLAAAVGNGVLVPIEIEYTTHSGAEG